MLLIPKYICRLPVVRAAALHPTHIRKFHLFPALLNESGRSMLGSLTDEEPTKIKKDDGGSPDLSTRLEKAAELTDHGETGVDRDSITIENDVELQKYIELKQQPQLPSADTLLSPLKRQIYKENCRVNGNFYKKDTIVKLPDMPGKYKLHLTREEIEILEPSVYMRSYRIKASMKKATVLLRLLNGLDVKRAITQCHFSQKKIARDVAELLQRGLESGKKLGIEADDLYIAQIWTGSDGEWMKRVDFQARGRHGIIEHPYVHVKCILKTKSVTKKRLAYEAEMKEKRKKPWIQLEDQPVRGVTGGVYKW